MEMEVKMKPNVMYIVVFQQIVGGDRETMRTDYHWDGRYFETRKAAIRDGLRRRGSDDFNIAVLTAGKMTSFDWMEEPVEGHIEEASAQLGLGP
jgi:hypothetical protein